MVRPPRKQSIPISPLPIAMLVFIVLAGAIAVLAFGLSKTEAPREAQETEIDTNLATACGNTCQNCSSKDYDARCFDRCRFGFKPYCD